MKAFNAKRKPKHTTKIRVRQMYLVGMAITFMRTKRTVTFIEGGNRVIPRYYWLEIRNLDLNPPKRKNVYATNCQHYKKDGDTGDDEGFLCNHICAIKDIVDSFNCSRCQKYKRKIKCLDI